MPLINADKISVADFQKLDAHELRMLLRPWVIVDEGHQPIAVVFSYSDFLKLQETFVNLDRVLAIQKETLKELDAFSSEFGTEPPPHSKTNPPRS